MVAAISQLSLGQGNMFREQKKGAVTSEQSPKRGNNTVVLSRGFHMAFVQVVYKIRRQESCHYARQGLT